MCGCWELNSQRVLLTVKASLQLHILMSPKCVIFRRDLGEGLNSWNGKHPPPEEFLFGRPGIFGTGVWLAEVESHEGGVCFCFWPQLSASCPSKIASISHSCQPGTALFLPPCLMPSPSVREWLTLEPGCMGPSPSCI